MKDIALFDYQEEMVARVQDAFRAHQSVMVQMPTGTGKTYLLAAVVRLFAPQEVWIVAHRRELVLQIEETIGRLYAAQQCAAIRVMSIQWLRLHYRELEEQPALIVIDEAHHAVANTYAEVMKAFPMAKKLGLTATPCRLNGEGFADLFGALLTSWSVERFIAKGRLSLYDYYSIKPDGLDQRLIDSLTKRGADGDYLQKEMNEVMDVRPSLERLCMTVKRYVAKKKGIVYAISIAHAEHIAAFYRENGIQAVAISSKTPLRERREQIDRFKKGYVQVLVSVDLFSEGFDCPDVEFVQLARPTLSLSKYLQMVGRGLRVASGKSYCVILDNVGLYRRFGMPSADRDWQQMFEGQAQRTDSLQAACMRINNGFCRWSGMASDGEEMMKIMGHERQKMMLGADCETEIEKDEKGWIDRRSGVRFAKRPQTVSVLGVEFCTADGKKLYPRIRSRFIGEKAYVDLQSLELQVGRGICWKRMLIPLDEPDKVYLLKDKTGGVRRYVDEAGLCYAQGNPDMELTPVSSQEEMDAYCRRCAEEEKAAWQKHEERYKHGHSYPIHSQAVLWHDKPQREAEDVWHVPNDVYGESYWVDGMSGMKHYSRPVPQQRGFVRLLKEDDWYYVRNIPGMRGMALRNWQIVADDNICVINNEFLFLRQEPRRWFKIFRRTDDYSHFVVKEHRPGRENSYTGLPDIIITRDGVKSLKRL